MKARVIEINIAKALVAVLTEEGDYSIFEMLSDDEFEKGDIVVWNSTIPLGDCMIKNHTQEVNMEVYFQNHHISASAVKDQMR